MAEHLNFFTTYSSAHPSNYLSGGRYNCCVVLSLPQEEGTYDGMDVWKSVQFVVGALVTRPNCVVFLLFHQKYVH